MREIVLASQSPRRKELLEKTGFLFICDPADIDETINLEADLVEESKNLSRRKAETVLERHPEAIVIGSDTLVLCDNQVMGKPEDDADAFQMLKKLQNHKSQVLTSLCIISKKKCFTYACITDVYFSKMSDEEIWNYIHTGETADKAGAYAIQGFGGRYIKEIHGDYYAIMGLPLQVVYDELKNSTDY